jgi:hypothetical protein
MSTPTPGPWKPYEISPYSYAIHGDIGALTESPIANVIFGLRAETSREQAENAQANARLMAASPELLEALINLVADWERVHGPIPQDHEAKAAMAKAKGAS